MKSFKNGHFRAFYFLCQIAAGMKKLGGNDISALCLDCGVSMGANICPNPLNCTLKWVYFIVCEVYLKKVDF